MNDAEILAYVQASAQLLALPLDDTRAQAVATHLGRTAQLAAQLEAFPMAMEDEICEIFSPAAFPSKDPSFDSDV
jgi:hypothetical protein